MTLMPIIIKVARSVNLLDQPDNRKIHSISTPSMGGIAIFCGVIIALLFSVSMIDVMNEKYFLGGILMIFLLGIRDDLSSLQANHKLVVQVFAAALIVFFNGIEIHGLNGLFGWNDFPWYFNELFTIFIIVVMTNAFNLLDGIDGLAGSVGLLVSLGFCFLFYQVGDMFSASVSMAIAGALIAFLLYNWFPSRVFMGDTGSMMLGFILSVLVVKYLLVPVEVSGEISPVAVILSFLILPVYDTLRVFIIRFLAGRPPLSPDRNHIHHVLLKLGFNHGQAALRLIAFNIAIVVLVYLFQFLGELWLILAMATTVITIGAILDRKIAKRESARQAKLDSGEIRLTKSA